MPGPFPALFCALRGGTSTCRDPVRGLANFPPSFLERRLSLRGSPGCLFASLFFSRAPFLFALAHTHAASCRSDRQHYCPTQTENRRPSHSHYRFSLSNF